MRVLDQSKTGWIGGSIGIGLLYALLLWGDRRLPGTFAQDTPVESIARYSDTSLPHAPLGNHHSKKLTGKGVTIGHVEGSRGNYLPKRQSPDYSGVDLQASSGPSRVNGHAQATSKIIYGHTGLAPGVTDVRFYTTSHWMGRGVLRSGSKRPPVTDGRRLFTNSWIGNRDFMATDVLRRVDALIDEHDVVIVVGVNNGAESPVPLLLGSAHNVIAVGVASGNSSGGYTQYEGKGRCKPDVVARRSTTSMATPVVTSIIARLMEAADDMESAPFAGRSEVIKAVLMAGAAKPENWQRQSGKPLDEHLGAGVARLAPSHTILHGGPSGSGRVMDSYGWDFQALPRREQQDYSFAVTQPVGEVSVILAWNRRITGMVKDLLTGEERWSDLPRSADFNLRLLAVSPEGQADVVAESASAVDNVEHIYVTGLPPGQYRLEVSRRDRHRERWDYAIAWRMDE